MANNIIGFRPNRSEARPQGIAVQHWAIEKMADMIPAHFPTSLGGTPKDSIISGRYGKTLVKDMGSAKRHSAKIVSWATGSRGRVLELLGPDPILRGRQVPEGDSESRGQQLVHFNE
jgi:hypothetical protein